jgi:hypothetical protein
MSWSIHRQGTKAELLASLPSAFDEAAANYNQHNEMRDEYRDVLGAKESALTMVANAQDVDDNYGAIAVSAYGSRSSGWGGSCHVTVERVAKPKTT